MVVADRRRGTERMARWLPPALAGGFAVVALVVGLRGVDFPAQLYRVGLFHRDGLVVWDSQWYGGHWTLDYSVLFPPVAGVFGVQVTAVASAVLAALAFDRLAVAHFGPRARLGSVLFAAGTSVQVVIGQLPFLLGESLALAAFWAASRRRWGVAAVLALLSAGASPLAGAFLGLALVPWLLTARPGTRARVCAIAVAALTPVAVLSVLFPGQGSMPFPASDFVQLLALFAGVVLVIPGQERLLRVGAALYLAAIAGSFVLSTPVGGNVSRLGECLGAPLAICVLWPRRRWLLAAAIVPLVALEWSPAFATLQVSGDPSAHAAYYVPLLQFLAGHGQPAGRVEVVPTRTHWEADYVAPKFPLARGWERQLDTADNPLFYERGALTPSTYSSWLVDNGVRYVALPDVHLDYAGQAEGRLLVHGVKGLSPVWSSGHWRVFQVGGSRGIVDGPASLLHLEGGQVDLHVAAPGTVLVRVRYDPRWDVVADVGCVRPTPAGWTELLGAAPGDVRLQLRLVGDSDALCSPPT